MIARLPAKSLADFKLLDDAYKADFELTNRFQSFATELERLSLLGIGSYGFLLGTVAFDKGNPTRYLFAMKAHAYLLAFGVLAFAFAAACALCSNFLTNRCLGCQLDIVRMFNRLDSERWTPEEQLTNLAFARGTQIAQKKLLIWNRMFLFLSTVLLCAGALAVAFAFASIIFSI